MSDRFTPCAGCGCARHEHFEHTGVCDLGFCRRGCSAFVEPPA